MGGIAAMTCRWVQFMKPVALWVIVLCLLTACGFQLRGGVDSALQRVHVSSERGVQLLVPLRERLSGLGISLVNKSGQPEILVHLIADNFNRRTISVTGRVLAAEYELTMSVDYQISRGESAGSVYEPEASDKPRESDEPQASPGSQALQQRHLEVSRIFAIDQGNLVGSSEEQTLLMAEMREDLVQQIVRNMNALASP